MAEITPPNRKVFENNDKEHQYLAESSAQTSHNDSGSSELSCPLKPWEKPGAWGKTRRSWRSVQRYIWDDPNKLAEEKQFLLKLDFFLLTYTCLGYFCKSLDQSNVNNAYVSGMKEALNMEGSELTYLGNIFTAGYVVGQLPAVILCTKIRPSILVSSLEILWAVFTFLCAIAKTTQQMYALRFLVGLCEGAFFPCIVYVIGSWYTKSERGKRMCLFYCTASLASMFSGYLQAAAYNNLSGRLGYSGWQWLFLICGIISLPIGVLGVFFNPDFPEITRAFYLKKEEIVFARERLLRDGYKPLGASAWDRTKIFRIMRHWQFWVLPVGYLFVQSSLPSQQPVFALWLKTQGKTVYQINVWPTGQTAIGVVVQVAAGMLTDSPLLNGRRWQAITVMQAGTLFAVVVLAVWNVPQVLMYIAFYMCYIAAGVPGLYFAMFSDVIKEDHEMRGFLIAFTNTFSYVNQIWFSAAFWPTIQAPRYTHGFIAGSVFGVCMILTTLLIRFLESRDERKSELENTRQVDVEAPAVVEIAVKADEKRKD